MGDPRPVPLLPGLTAPAPRISVRESLPGGALPVLGVRPPWAKGSPPNKGRQTPTAVNQERAGKRWDPALLPGRLTFIEKRL